MDLTHEETLRRIEEKEKNNILHRKYCKEKKYPYRISLYKGEGQIIVAPSITSIGWLYTEMAWHRKILDVQNSGIIGEIVLEALEKIRISPVDARTAQEREVDSVMVVDTSCKTYKEFNKAYLRCAAIYYEDGTWIISQTRRLAGNKGYGGDDSTLIYLPTTASAEDIGKAIVESFEGMEQFYSKKPKKEEPPRTNLDILSGRKFSFVEPSEEVYTDEQDFHAAEIYQGYSYYKEEDDESVADMYFASASELDCDMTPEHIQNAYEEYDGLAINFVYEDVEHSVFEQCIEMETASIKRIVYLKRISEDELFSCELVLKKKPAGKRLHNKIVKDFEAMVKSCREEI